MHRCGHSSIVGVPLGTAAFIATDDNGFPDSA
jgi:metal-dependent amidase/aminoacylase/carboxypeptidase family protein